MPRGAEAGGEVSAYKKLREILREPSSMYLVDAKVLSEAADAITTERKRADFFRDQLAEQGCPPRSLNLPCTQGCILVDDEDNPDFAACWDEVERRQR